MGPGPVGLLSNRNRRSARWFRAANDDLSDRVGCKRPLGDPLCRSISYPLEKRFAARSFSLCPQKVRYCKNYCASREAPALSVRRNPDSAGIAYLQLNFLGFQCTTPNQL